MCVCVPSRPLLQPRQEEEEEKKEAEATKGQSGLLEVSVSVGEVMNI